MSRKIINNKDRQTLLNQNEVIVLYKKGSKGEVVATYESVKDIEKNEKPFNNKFSVTSVYMCLNGVTKSFTSFFHGCRVVPKIKNTA